MNPPIDRAEFPVTERYVYLNHAGVAPLSRAAARIGNDFIEDFLVRGAVGFREWEAEMEGVRASAARLLGVDSTEVAFVKNTTEGLSFVAQGLAWAEGDRVLVPDREFPSTIYPWLSLHERGVHVDLVEPEGPGWSLPLERFEQALRDRPTKLVVVSWVQFSRGYRIDIAALAALCHEHGALLCVDAIQGLGVVPADFGQWGVDFAAADAHKWMLGPLGTGVFFCSTRTIEQLRPLEAGWASVAHREQWDNLELVYDPTARRFEGGSHTIETIMQMGASIDVLLHAGVDRIWSHVDGLLEHLVAALDAIGLEVLSDRDPAHRSGLVTVDVPGHEPEAVVDHLEARDIVAAARGGGVRLAPHGYNTIDEMDAVVHALRELHAGGSGPT